MRANNNNLHPVFMATPNVLLTVAPSAPQKRQYIKKARELSFSLAVPALVNRHERLNNRITLAYM